ncbi:MAG: hypothetical protein IPK32_12680 [Verrucomicrobiaceae bacterium]|nr:hypothetical protein [Verrucomicrobiaceae bacterium]
MHHRLLACLGLFWMLAAQSAVSCTIPVFRFALDRWEPSNYRLILPQEMAARPEIVDLLRPLRAGGVANLEIITAQQPGPTAAQLFATQDSPVPLWSGDINAQTLNALLDSPARQKLREQILQGTSITWIIADNQDKEEQRIATRLAFLEQAAALPIQDPNDPDSQLGPGPELKLSFRVQRLRLDDHAEKAFIPMLIGPEGKVKPDQPFAAAVFARGRALGAFPLAELDDAALEEACMFLIGRCSCRVKDQNPGWDLLMNVDWPKELQIATGKRPPSTTDPKVSPSSNESPAKQTATEPHRQSTATTHTIAPPKTPSVIEKPKETDNLKPWISSLALVALALGILFRYAGPE